MVMAAHRKSQVFYDLSCISNNKIPTEKKLSSDSDADADFNSFISWPQKSVKAFEKKCILKAVKFQKLV